MIVSDARVGRKCPVCLGCRFISVCAVSSGGVILCSRRSCAWLWWRGFRNVSVRARRWKYGPYALAKRDNFIRCTCSLHPMQRCSILLSNLSLFGFITLTCYKRLLGWVALRCAECNKICNFGLLKITVALLHLSRGVVQDQHSETGSFITSHTM